MDEDHAAVVVEDVEDPGYCIFYFALEYYNKLTVKWSMFMVEITCLGATRTVLPMVSCRLGGTRDTGC
jgi:hypothetical protein